MTAVIGLVERLWCTLDHYEFVEHDLKFGRGSRLVTPIFHMERGNLERWRDRI